MFRVASASLSPGESSMATVALGRVLLGRGGDDPGSPIELVFRGLTGSFLVLLGGDGGEVLPVLGAEGVGTFNLGLLSAII